ncbi:MAG: lysophospholipid acyltransferase family protein [Phycisphaerae bacterium]
MRACYEQVSSRHRKKADAPCRRGRADGPAEHAVSWCVNAVCILYAAMLSAVFETCFLVFLGFHVLLNLGDRDDAWRMHNGYYGAFMVRFFWPFVRLRRRGLANLLRCGRGGGAYRLGSADGFVRSAAVKGARVPATGSVMMVTNHRSLFDIFFFGLATLPNVAVLVRSWPFDLPIFGWFMRRAGYIDIERVSFDEAAEMVVALSRRGVSFLCFAEGHRSRDGCLQRFQSGAFRLAVACNLPIVPVCIRGTERLCAPGSHEFKPAYVTMEFFPAVDPCSFPDRNRALKLRRHVEGVLREYLGE